METGKCSSYHTIIIETHHKNVKSVYDYFKGLHIKYGFPAVLNPLEHDSTECLLL